MTFLAHNLWISTTLGAMPCGAVRSDDSGRSAF